MGLNIFDDTAEQVDVTCDSAIDASGLRPDQSRVLLSALATDETAAALSRHANVEKVILNGCSNISDLALHHLAHLPMLAYLGVVFCESLTPRGLLGLECATRVRVLDLSGSSGLVSDTHEQLMGVDNLVNLEAINLNWMYLLGDSGVWRLAQLRNLRALFLDACEQLSDTALKAIATIPALEVLLLPGFASFSDAGIALLPRSLTRLRHIAIGPSTTITDESLASLAESVSLEVVSLSCLNGVTGAGLARLCEAPSLQQVKLAGTNAFADTLLRLREQWPNVRFSVTC